MGNAPSGDAAVHADGLDDAAQQEKAQQYEGGSQYERVGGGEAHDTRLSPQPQAAVYDVNQNEHGAGTEHEHDQYQRHQFGSPESAGGGGEHDGDEDGGDESSPTGLLLQLLPYYGQEDEYTDQMARTLLQNMNADDLDFKDESGYTLLILACQYGYEDLVRILLSRGCDVDATDNWGFSSLHYACSKETQSNAIAHALLDAGSKTEAYDSQYGCTPLHYAASTGDMDLCKMLLANGANPAAQDYSQYVAADYAKEASMTQCEDFLRAKYFEALQAPNRGAMQNTIYTQGTVDGMPAMDALPRISSALSVGSGASPAAAGVGGTLADEDDDFDGAGGRKTGASAASAALRQKNQELDANVALPPTLSGAAWKKQTNPVNGEVYFFNPGTGEIVFEKDLAKKSEEGAAGGEPEPPLGPRVESWVRTQVWRTRLMAYLGVHDPTRMVEVDKMLEDSRGEEAALMQRLCTQYDAAEDSYFARLTEASTFTGKEPTAAPVTPARSSRASRLAPGSPYNRLSVDTSGAGIMAPDTQTQKALEEARVQFDRELEGENKKSRAELEESRVLIAKLEENVRALKDEKEALEKQLETRAAHLERRQQSEANLHADREQKINALTEQVSSLESDLAAVRAKSEALEQTLHGKESSELERIEAERQVAEAKAREQAERERAVREEAREHKEQLMRELRELRETWEEEKHRMEVEHTEEVGKLRQEHAEEREELAENVVRAQMDTRQAQEDAKKAEEAREVAESTLANMQDEIAEAQQIAQFNAQLHLDLHREQERRKKLHNKLEDMKGKIRVNVRVRPLSQSEIDRECKEVCIRDNKSTCSVVGEENKNYEFDHVFGNDDNTQEDIFKDTKALVLSVTDGYNVCVFAYGQTGGGKTYTMIGPGDVTDMIDPTGDPTPDAGILPRAVIELFKLVGERHAQCTFEIQLQMFELYQNNLRDLLESTYKREQRRSNARNKKKKAGGGGDSSAADEPPATLKVKLAEHSPTGLVMVEGATELIATSPEQMLEYIQSASRERATSSTRMNADSSRSHLICSMVTALINRRSGSRQVGKLTLVDLAGSERVGKSGATGEQLKEAQSINKSLSALGDVIHALTTGSPHIPYRNHPLTMVMSDSIGGAAKTLMMVCCSPADYNAAESNNSLTFASRCKDVTSAPGGGTVAQASQLAALRKELARLKKSGGGKKRQQAGLARPM